MLLIYSYWYHLMILVNGFHLTTLHIMYKLMYQHITPMYVTDWFDHDRSEKHNVMKKLAPF